MSRLILIVVLAIGIFVGIVVIDTIDDEVKHAAKEKALSQIKAACNAQLPGENWTVKNDSVNEGDLTKLQQAACERNGTVKKVNVDIEINVSS